MVENRITKKINTDKSKEIGLNWQGLLRSQSSTTLCGSEAESATSYIYI